MESVNSIPSSATKQERNGPIILAYGEATGHHHAIHDEFVDLLTDELAGGVTYIEVRVAMAALTHQEHATIAIPKGKYLKIQQRQYTPEAIIRVVD